MIRLRIRETAERRGISKPIDLARKTGLSFSVIHKLWNDQQTRIDLKTIESLCRCLGVAPGELFEIDGGSSVTSPAEPPAEQASTPVRRGKPSWID